MADSLSQDDLNRLVAELPRPVTDPRYSVRVDLVEGVMFLRIIGTILQPIPDEFIARLQDLFRRNQSPKSVVDLSRCAFISSSAIGVLVEYFKITSAAGGQVLLIRPTDKVLKLIEILGLMRFFLVVDDEEMAINYYQTQGKL
jgi:anti-anti-sigma factor